MSIVKLKQYVLQKQAEWGREITIKEISEQTGVSRDTISRMLNASPTRIDEGTIKSLCKFFNVPAGPVPFIIYQPDEEQHEQPGRS